ncbi:CLUMA_CG015980, isoform A [Clunio marinus]|uniref:CLUMA_CG015980, isoform A n=1 Tax=Clunio marinus TaxID=568069 RepID=A0A1J1IQU4_9DIPT|nr:CLUMA_CG015980, isoform A [Clunio marinus]
MPNYLLKPLTQRLFIHTYRIHVTDHLMSRTSELPAEERLIYFETEMFKDVIKGKIFLLLQIDINFYVD